MNTFSKFRENIFLHIFILLGISVVSHFPFVLESIGEPDSARIAIVVIDRIKNGIGGPLSNFYFTDTIPLYVLYLSWAMKVLNFNYSYLPAVMNYTNAIFATLAIIPAYLFIKRLFRNATIAFCSVLVLIFAPTFYQNSLYGNPHIIALFFSFSSLYFYLVWLDNKHIWIKYTMLILSVLTLLVTLLFKTSFVLASGIYLGILYLRKTNDRKTISLSIFSLILPFIAFLLIRRQIVGPSGSTSSIAEILDFFSFFLAIPNPGYMVRLLKPLILGTGVLTFLLGIISFIYYVYRKRLDILIFVISWIAISHTFWLLIKGSNARSFTIGILPVAVMGIMFFYEKAPKYVIALTVALILGNYFITNPSPLTYFPSGNLFKSRMLLNERVNLYHLKAKEIVNLAEDKIAVMGYFHNPYVVYEIVRSTPSYEAKKIGREDYIIRTGSKEYVICYIDKINIREAIEKRALAQYRLNNHLFVSLAYDLSWLNSKGITTKDMGILESFQHGSSFRDIFVFGNNY